MRHTGTHKHTHTTCIPGLHTCHLVLCQCLWPHTHTHTEAPLRANTHVCARLSILHNRLKVLRIIVTSPLQQRRTRGSYDVIRGTDRGAFAARLRAVFTLQPDTVRLDLLLYLHNCRQTAAQARKTQWIIYFHYSTSYFLAVWPGSELRPFAEYVFAGFKSTILRQ